MVEDPEQIVVLNVATASHEMLFVIYREDRVNGTMTTTGLVVEHPRETDADLLADAH